MENGSNMLLRLVIFTASSYLNVPSFHSTHIRQWGLAPR